jgi:hypothetical protein
LLEIAKAAVVVIAGKLVGLFGVPESFFLHENRRAD